MRTAPIILLAAGGTAGHMYPASALARQLKTEGYTPHLATDKRGLQYIQKLESMVVHKLPAATIFGKGIMAVPLKLITLGASFVASIYLLVRLRPQAVVGFGGYPSFAPAMVGLLLGKRVLIHEQNAVLGRANRVLAMLGAKLATSFRQTKHIPPQTRRRFTGNPIRQDIEMAALAPYPDPSTTPFQILIFGGSQGAQVLSQIIPQALCALPQDLRIRIRIVHQVAEQDMQETQNEYKAGSIDANIKTYFDDMPMQMRAAHLVICRGGASTIAELTALGVPAIIVPLQNSLDQDQSYNAQALARSGAQIIPQNELSPDSIATSIEGFMRNPERLHDAAAGAKSLGVTDGASRLGDYLHQLVQHKTERPLYHDAVQSFCGDGAVHIIGIGGIGMSGIAEILVNAGCVVQGSDIASNANTARLEKLGVTIFIGHSGAHIVKNKVSMVTHSPAIQADNPELVAAQDAQINIANRAAILAAIMQHSPTITIAGTHGKTTTSALVAAILTRAKFDPTIISGGIMGAYNSNVQCGNGDWLVVEADESDGTFVHLPSTIGVVTNIEPEHLEHYGDMETLLAAFSDYLNAIPFFGGGVVCADDDNIRNLIKDINHCPLISYGAHETANIRAINHTIIGAHQRFDIEVRLKDRQTQIKDIILPMAGQHNLQNTLAAVAVAFALDVTEKDIRHALRNFKGVDRRFTHIGRVQGIDIYNDYAHHPTEIAATLAAAKTITKNRQGRVIAVVQPHRYSRLHRLFAQFAASFTDADEVIILPVYAAGETPIEGADSTALASATNNNASLNAQATTAEDLAVLLQGIAQSGDIIVCMGAGDIAQIAHTLPQHLEGGLR